MSRIPKVLHFCFGLVPDFGGKGWSLIHHASVASAVARIGPERVYFYYEYEPTGPWWPLTRQLVTPVRIVAPREIFGRPLAHPAHRADVVRLEKLIEHGGIYLDADVLVHRDFDELLDHSTVLGQEGFGLGAGLCNAVILAEPDAPFLKRWHAEYKWFRGSGSEYWNEHSVILPARLAAEHPDEITIAPPTAFFWPLWTDEHIDWLFNSDEPIPETGAYANHLWESRAWKYLEFLTPGQVRARDTNFHRWARPYLDGLPDDHGRASIDQRLAGLARDGRSWLGAKVDALGGRMKGLARPSAAGEQ